MRNLLIATLTLASFNAMAITEQTQLIHQKSFKANLSLSGVGCHYTPDGDFTREGIHIHVDENAIVIAGVPQNKGLGIYGSKNSTSIMDRGQDCSLMSKLWEGAPRGAIEIQGIRKVSKQVRRNFDGGRDGCKIGYLQDISFDMPENLNAGDSRDFIIQTARGDKDCVLDAPLKTDGIVFVHIRSIGADMKCEQTKWHPEDKFVLKFGYARTDLGEVTQFISTELPSLAACEAEKTRIIELSKADDPNNRGQRFKATRSLEKEITTHHQFGLPAPLKRATLINTVKTTIYNLEFASQVKFNLKNL